MLRLFLRSPFIVVGAVFMAFTISRKLTLIFIAAILLLSLVIFLIVRTTLPIYRRVQQILGYGSAKDPGKLCGRQSGARFFKAAG